MHILSQLNKINPKKKIQKNKGPPSLPRKPGSGGCAAGRKGACRGLPAPPQQPELAEVRLSHPKLPSLQNPWWPLSSSALRPLPMFGVTQTVPALQRAPLPGKLLSFPKHQRRPRCDSIWSVSPLLSQRASSSPSGAQDGSALTLGTKQPRRSHLPTHQAPAALRSGLCRHWAPLQRDI